MFAFRKNKKRFHKERKKLISIYLDGELDEEQERELSDHLSVCKECKKELEDMPPDQSLWPSKGGSGLASSTFYTRIQKYFDDAGLPRAGIHVFRHTVAKLRMEAGESVKKISRFLDHSSLAVTSTYLRRLSGNRDRGWRSVAEAVGI